MKLKRLFAFIICLLTFSCSICATNVFANDNYVYLGGMPAGFLLNSRGAYVVGLCDVVTESCSVSPAKDAGLSAGDVILYIDNIEINSAFDIQKAVINDNLVKVTVERNGLEEYFLIKPQKDVTGNYKIGVFIRDNVNGIGTITYIKDNYFASLGHPVLNECGNLLQITGGNLYKCNITGYVRGERGRAGELRGIFVKNAVVGNIEKNCEEGVYGYVNGEFDKSNLTKIEIGEAKVGNAKIYTTLNGHTPKEYDISIIKTDNDFNGNKNYFIRINDKRLIDTTGGIVQGMSGSPIVQGGKLVGAVTHVFINDPTRGFGISISNMLNN